MLAFAIIAFHYYYAFFDIFMIGFFAYFSSDFILRYYVFSFLFSSSIFSQLIDCLAVFDSSFYSRRRLPLAASPFSLRLFSGFHYFLRLF